MPFFRVFAQICIGQLDHQQHKGLTEASHLRLFTKYEKQKILILTIINGLFDQHIFGAEQMNANQTLYRMIHPLLYISYFFV